jgi:hypothetical protein
VTRPAITLLVLLLLWPAGREVGWLAGYAGGRFVIEVLPKDVGTFPNCGRGVEYTPLAPCWLA